MQRGVKSMNISDPESPLTILAKTCGGKGRNMKVTYSIIDSYHSLCLDKKDIISAEIEACQRLSKYTVDEFVFIESNNTL
jgi:hypothetical protein